MVADSWSRFNQPKNSRSGCLKLVFLFTLETETMSGVKVATAHSHSFQSGALSFISCASGRESLPLDENEPSQPNEYKAGMSLQYQGSSVGWSNLIYDEDSASNFNEWICRALILATVPTCIEYRQLLGAVQNSLFMFPNSKSVAYARSGGLALLLSNVRGNL
ncbi:hypothetical protein RUM44_007685 [Polyplax serrata]|uniref:Uncharacterized protein n=1 Tax=Polyplax serrata TaxID=468196 RepID=A0ABR1BA99_POLSC